MRISEILALRWRDILFNEKRIVVTRSAHHGKEGYHINSTKTGKPRTIPVSDKVITFLRKHRVKQNDNKKVYSLHEEGLAFLRRNGQVYNRSTVGNIFRYAAGLHGVRISLNGLRHTHATLLLMAGVPLPIVSERLGHSRYSTTLNEYVHAIPPMQGEAVRVFDKLMAKGNRASDSEIAELFFADDSKRYVDPVGTFDIVVGD